VTAGFLSTSSWDPCEDSNSRRHPESTCTNATTCSISSTAMRRAHVDVVWQAKFTAGVVFRLRWTADVTAVNADHEARGRKLLRWR
jgi:hypothetical protein